MNKYMTKLFQFFGAGQSVDGDINQADNNYRSITDADVSKFLSNVDIPTKESVVDITNLPTMLEPLSKELKDRKIDNDKLASLAPEIEQAASILIPSILSPNDFKKSEFNLIVDTTTESTETLAPIVQLLNTHFGESLGMSTKLSEWLNTSLFQIGAKPIMILPEQMIKNLRDKNLSLEALDKEIQDTCRPARDVPDNIPDYADFIDTISSLEDFDLFLDRNTPSERKAKASPEIKIAQMINSSYKAIAKKFDKDGTLTFSDNVQLLAMPDEIIRSSTSDSNDALVAALESAFVREPPPEKDEDKTVKYDTHTYIDLTDVEDGEDGEYPSMIELPTESCIPITIEGSPSNHVGYLILLNENGIPVTSKITSVDMDVSQTESGGNTRINNLYASFYGTSYNTLQKKMTSKLKYGIIEKVYRGYLKKVMDNNLDSLGMGKFDVNITNDISRVMFSRLMKETKTTILFVPKSLISYIAFEYHDDGTGRSKIDKIKFPLSLKMTLIIVRLISLIESSINRRKLEITLDDNVPNPLEVLRTIKKEFVKNKMYGITYDPSTIIKSVLDKEITIVPNKIPGVEEFNITDSENTVNYPRPDDAILEEINKMYTLSLDVPPSAMNRLGENEFSRSVAASNIFFSNKLRGYQTIVKTHVTKIVTTYVSYSGKLKGSIAEILSKSEHDENSKDNIAERVATIIRSIKFTLPSPNIAADKAQFEEIREYLNILDRITETLFSEDLVERDNQDTVKQYRAHVKKTILAEYIKTNNAFSDTEFDNMTNIDITSIADTGMKIANIKALVDEMSDKLKGNEGGEEAGGTNKW